MLPKRSTYFGTDSIAHRFGNGDCSGPITSTCVSPGRLIPREVILEAVETFEVVEVYAEDEYLPSYFVLGRSGVEAFHVLFATDLEGDNVRVVTVYHPDAAEWLDDLKTRRRKP